MLSTIIKALGGSKKLSSDLTQAISSSVETLINVLQNESTKNEIASWYASRSKILTKDSWQEVSAILGNEKKNKSVEEALSLLKTQTCLALDFKDGLVYGFDIRQVLKAYNGILRDKLFQVLKGGTGERMIAAEASDQFHMNLIKGKTEDLVIVKMINSLSLEQKAQLSMAKDLEETIPLLEECMSIYLKKIFEARITSSVREQLLGYIETSRKELCKEFPLAKKSKYMISSLRQLNIEINEYLQVGLKEVIGDILLLVKEPSKNNRNTLFGKGSFIVNYYYDLNKKQDLIIEKIYSYMMRRIESTMANEHNSNTYKQYIQLRKDLKTEDSHLSEYRDNADTDAANKALPNLSQEDSDMVHIAIDILGIDDPEINKSLFNYIRRMILRGRPVKVETWLKIRGLARGKDLPREDFFAIFDQLSVPHRYERNGTPSDISNEEVNTEDTTTETSSSSVMETDSNISSASFIELAGKYKFVLSDKASFIKKYNTLLPNQQKALHKLFTHAQTHPVLRRRRPNNLSFIKFGDKYRLATHKSVILGIFAHGDDYEKLYPLFL